MSTLTCNGTLTEVDARTILADAGPGAGELRLQLPLGPVFVLDGTTDLFVLPSSADRRPLIGTRVCWVLPEDTRSTEPAWLITAPGAIRVELDEHCTVIVSAGSAVLTRHRARPHADVTGAEIRLDLPGADELLDALAGFTWGTMLPCVVERTTASEYDDADGYVISTLADTYVGTYPDVDHEFQIKGRLAWGDPVDLHVVRRMIELQLRLMREDPQQLWRNPCAVQPNGTREYHVRRNSLDNSQNAVMFLLTGNVEVLESIWCYVARTKDLRWLADHLEDIEGAASGVSAYVDHLGRLWSDVYYEDQVIKDGRETMAAALAVRSFHLLAELELLLLRTDQASAYGRLAEQLSAALRSPLPIGHWDADARRFVDWVDRSGVSHDHLHLLANVLPVLVGATDDEQTRSVLALVDREFEEYQRFPTFLAARIGDYTDDEIGDGGPYDLCAAGRYWCWDAAFWSWRGNGRVLADQLLRVARQGAADDYVMGERYDLDHVYYVDGSSWHGAAHYYEYPCVFTWVLFTEYLGLRGVLDADLLIAPRLADHGSVELQQEAYRLSYAYRPDGFTLTNLADRPRTFRLDLSALGLASPSEPITVEPGESFSTSGTTPDARGWRCEDLFSHTQGCDQIRYARLVGRTIDPAGDAAVHPRYSRREVLGAQ